MNGKRVNPFVLLVCFLMGLAGLLAVRFIQVHSVPAFVAQRSDFTLKPPLQALSGELTTTKGHVEKLSRDENGFKEASAGAHILIGESIATKEKSEAHVSVANAMNIIVNEKAELVFTNLFPDSVVLQQKSGKIQYDVEETHTANVRALHTLVYLTSGTIIINIIDTDVSVTVKSGLTKFALVDTDNNTQTYELSKGQRANINDKAREVYLVGKR